jgi:hypothetical protein
MIKPKPISREQAEWIYARWREICIDTYGHFEDITGECLLEALDELTAKPGEVEFCWPGRTWDRICQWWKQYDTLGDVEKCVHPDYRPGHCPLEKELR